MCGIMRESTRIAETIAQKLGQKDRIFEGLIYIVVGSLKEQTRMFDLDEMDVSFLASKKVTKGLHYDRINQVINIRPDLPADHPLAPYKDENNNFNAKKYFDQFLTHVYEIIQEMEENWPPVPGLTMMEKLSVQYKPCCFKEDFTILQPVRCKHRADCRDHSNDDDDCQEYNSQSITRSKIGVVLHMAFRLTEGTVHHVDMDLCVPSVSASNGQEYDGDTNDYERFLMRTRPVLWREEIIKLESMTCSAIDTERCIRVRSINPDTVTTSEVRMVEFSNHDYYCIEKDHVNMYSIITTMFRVYYS
jgi:hypothetical protein